MLPLAEINWNWLFQSSGVHLEVLGLFAAMVIVAVAALASTLLRKA